jgi:hypothetical protein
MATFPFAKDMSSGSAYLHRHFTGHGFQIRNTPNSICAKESSH